MLSQAISIYDLEYEREMSERTYKRFRIRACKVIPMESKSGGLEDRIWETRNRLNDAIERKGRTASDTLRISEELDKLILRSYRECAC